MEHDANSKEHPARWKPGQTGNPNGVPKIEKEIKSVRQLTRQDTITSMHKVLNMTIEEIQVLMKAKDSKASDLLIASVIAKAIATGDVTRINFLYDRLFGKQLTPISLEGSMHTNIMVMIDKMKEVTPIDGQRL